MSQLKLAVRNFRLLLLFAFLFLAGSAYVKIKERPQRPTRSAQVSGRTDEWQYSLHKGEKQVGLIHAKTMRALRDSPVIELDGATLELYRDDGKNVDRIESAKMFFNPNTQALYSDGVSLY